MRFERMRRIMAVAMSVLLAADPVLQPIASLAQTPTAEQLKVFQSLPQAQRDAILQQMGIGGTKGVGVSPESTTDGGILVQQPGIANAEAEAAAQRAKDAMRERDPRIKGGEQLLIELVLPDTEFVPSAIQPLPQSPRPAFEPRKPEREARKPDVEKSLNDLRTLILKGNPYELSPAGVLQLPGLRPISLAGLTGKEAQQRLALDPALREFTVALTVLRLDPQGAKALKPYGYDIFRDAANALVPGTDIPVPDDYKIGPGDTINVQLYGQQTGTYSLPVGRDGTISLPTLGPVNVSGMGFGSVRGFLEGRVKKQMIGTSAHVFLSELRTARVLVLGDAERPGTYVVAGLSTATTALFASGGVKPIGSLRTIEIRRDGNLVRKLDLYDVLLKGNTASDVQLQTGDAVFVPPIGSTVGIEGAVHRPAIYELSREKTVGELVALAGGLSPTADSTSVTVERIDSSHDRRMISLKLGTTDGRAFVLQDGDMVRVGAVRPVIDNGIVVEGHVYRPGTYAYRPGIRLSDVLESSDDLKPRADLNYVLIRREAPDRRTVSVFSADLLAALAHPGSSYDIALNPRDRIDVFDLISPRDEVVKPLLEEMSRQARPSDPMSVVEITGRVNAPGRYPLEGGMRVGDLLRAGGGLQDAAYSLKAELTRYDVVGGERRRSDLQVIDLAAITSGDADANVELKPYDVLTIQETPEWGRVENVTLRGEVQFPGTYRIRRGESLRSVLTRAGGLTPLAFPEGAVFTREELKAREREQLDRLADRMQHDIAALSLQATQTNPGATESLAAGRALLDQVKAAKPVGRLVIDLKKILASDGGAESAVTLRDGDTLAVPRLTQEVTVLGEVQSPTSHLYRPGLRRDDVVELSGGLTARADRARVYVVRADGSVVATPSSWFGSRSTEVRPGDTVVVPFDAEKMRPLPMWTAITTIIYNLAIAATAVARL
jgi:polysaccharide biosynthesis/export protein